MFTEANTFCDTRLESRSNWEFHHEIINQERMGRRSAILHFFLLFCKFIQEINLESGMNSTLRILNGLKQYNLKLLKVNLEKCTVGS